MRLTCYSHHSNITNKKLPAQVGSEEESSPDSRHVALESPSRMYPVSHWNEQESLYTTLAPDWHGPSNVDRCAEYSGIEQLTTSIWERRSLSGRVRDARQKQNIRLTLYSHHSNITSKKLPVQVGSEEESSPDSRHVTLEAPSRMYPVSHWNEQESLYTILQPDWHGPSNVDSCAEYSGTEQLTTIWWRSNGK